MNRWLSTTNRYRKIEQIQALLIRIFGSSAVIVPTLISLLLVAFSQIIRGFFNYPTFPVLFVVPFIVLVVLSLSAVLTRTCTSVDNIEHKKSNTFRIIFEIIIILTIILMISARLIGIVWGSKYLSPVYEAQYISGHAHIDTLFHAAISNMLIFFGYPSIGVEGIVPFPYHFGSHLIIAGVSRLLHFSVIQTYHLVYPTLILPLWLGSFLLLTDVIRRKWFSATKRRWLDIVALIVFFISISGLMPENFRDSVGAWNNIIISESYAFSIMFLYLFAAILIQYVPKNSGLAKPFRDLIFYSVSFFGVVGLTSLKVSVGTLWCVGLVVLWISDLKNMQKLFAAIFSGIGWFCILPFIQSSAGMSSNWHLGHFIFTYVDIENISYYLIVNYGWTLLSLLIIQVQIVKNNISKITGRIMQLILGCVAIVGALPGMLIPIGAGSASYFISVNVWVSVPLLAVLLSSLLSEKKMISLITSNVLTTVFTLLLVASPIMTPLFNTLRSLAVLQKRTETYINTIDQSSKELWNILSQIEQDKKHLQVLKYDHIPAYGSRGHDHQRTWMTTYLSAAAISGIPTINKVEEANELLGEDQIGWGFDGLLFNSEQKGPSFEANTLHVRHSNDKLILTH